MKKRLSNYLWTLLAIVILWGFVGLGMVLAIIIPDYFISGGLSLPIIGESSEDLVKRIISVVIMVILFPAIAYLIDKQLSRIFDKITN